MSLRLKMTPSGSLTTLWSVESGTLLPNYSCTPPEVSIRECGTLVEKFEFSRAFARMDGLRLGAERFR